MKQDRCPMCFQLKPLVPGATPALPEQCKGCFFKVDQILGYLAFHGVTTIAENQLSGAEKPLKGKAKE